MKKYTFIFAIMVASVAQAQQIKTYEGAMNLPSELKVLGELYDVSSNDIHCQGSYQYYENPDGDRIKHDSFNFLSIKIGYPDILIDGRYSHGKKDGRWTIRAINKNGEMVKPHMGIAYNQHCGGFTINYKNDSLSGDYLLIGTSDGGIYETQYSGKIVNGRIQGKVSFKKTMTLSFGSVKDNSLANECEMTGEIGSDGMPTGIWTVSDKGGIEKVQRRYFHNGVLVAIDEMDNSTGERTLCYCAFDGLKKVPNMQEIKDSVSGNDIYIIYNGQVAIKTKDDKSIDYNSHLGRYSMGDYAVSLAVPLSLMKLSKVIETQVVGWAYVYSEKKIKEIQEQKRKERELFVKDSIRQAENAQNERKWKEKAANEKFDRFWEGFMEKHLGSIYGMYTIINTNGKIKKCEQINDVTSFIISKNETLRGHFAKQNVKTNAGNTYQPSDENATILENDEHTMIVFIYKYGKTNFSFLIVKDKDQHLDRYGRIKAVYEIKDSALKCLNL